MTYKNFLIKISRCFDQIGLRHLERKLKNIFFKIPGYFLGAKPVEKIEDTQIQNILIIRQHNQMGDMLCSTPLFAAVRKRFQGAHITLIASEVNLPVVQHHPAIDRVLLFEKQNFLAQPGGFFRFWRSLRERKYDLGIVPSTVSMSVTSDLLCFVARTRYRLGVRTLNGEANPSAFIYNLPVDLDWRENHQHQTERNLVILKPIGWNEPAGALSIGVSPEDEIFATRFLQQHAAANDVIIGMHPGAGKVPNRWPTEHFARLAEHLAEKFGVKIFITCGPMDADVVETMVAALKIKATVCQNFSLTQLAALMRKMRLYITNDTGTMHLAAAAGVPTLSLFGPTDPHQWAPPGAAHRFLAANNGNIESISLEQVQMTAKAMLS
jgi:heptosyltransferase-2